MWFRVQGLVGTTFSVSQSDGHLFENPDGIILHCTGPPFLCSNESLPNVTPLMLDISAAYGTTPQEPGKLLSLGNRLRLPLSNY